MGKKEKKKTPQAWEEGTRSQLADIRAHVNTAFDKYYGDGQLGLSPQEYAAFVAILRTPLPVTFRLSGCPSSTHALALRDAMVAEYVPTLRAALPSPPQPLPWYPAQLAWQFDVSRAELRGKGAAADAPPPAGAATLAAFHAWLLDGTETGRVQRQELVSMVPTLLLGVAPGHRVLDMCASPGSKTQQLIEWLDGRGLVVANDADRKRCHLMVSRASKLLSPLLFAINHDARLLPEELTGADGVAAPWRFDRVLCDVPCSGDGTLRKAPAIWRQWTVGSGNALHRLQLQIACKGARLLAVGGTLVYSTCSLNPVENEAVVAQLLKEFGGSLALVDVSSQLPQLRRRPGLATWRVWHRAKWHDTWASMVDRFPRKCPRFETLFPPTAAEAAAMHLDRCLRLFPQDNDSGGFFVAVFEKVADHAPDAGALAPEDSQEVCVVEGAAILPEALTRIADGAAEGAAATAEAASTTEEAADAGADAVPAEAGEAAAAGDGLGLDVMHMCTNLPKRQKEDNGEFVYQPLFVPPPEMVDEIATFFGIGDSFPLARLAARSVGALTLVLVGPEARALLAADGGGALRLVHTGVRCFERDVAKGTSCAYRVCQSGLPLLLPHLTRQRGVLSAAAMGALLSDSTVRPADWAAADVTLAGCAPGSVVLRCEPPAAGAAPLHAVALLAPSGALHAMVAKAERSSLLRQLNGASQ